MSFEIKFKFLDSALRSAKVPNEKTPENNSHQQNKLFRKRLNFQSFFHIFEKHKSLWLKKIKWHFDNIRFSRPEKKMNLRMTWLKDQAKGLSNMPNFFYTHMWHVYSIANCEGQNFLRPSFRPTSSKSSADSSDSEPIKILQRLTVGECHKVLTLRQM